LDSLHTGIATLDEEAVLQRETSAETELVSRSHGRRLKRKAKEQLGGGLGDLHNAIETMVDSALLTDAAAEGEESLKPPKSSAIGKGSPSTLSKSQRKRVL
jgi:ribosome biogenesis protein SLX9